MTDNEIIKALECCTYNITQEKCDECPLYGGHCTTKLAKNALDLINRQKAEIEILSEAIYKGTLTTATQLRAEENYFRQQVERIKRAKTEAVKEFACELERSLINMPQKDINYSSLVEHIENLVKERVGDAK